MLRFCHVIFFLSSIFAYCQKSIPLDSLQLKDAQDILGDDYGNIYVYHKKDFSLTKYDSAGAPLSKVMMTFPYKIQSVINPLNIVMFSENAQEIKFLDQNLNEIQKINLSSNFGFVKAVYAEDLQYAWVIDDSNKTLIQYNFRNNSIFNSFPFNVNLQDLLDFLVYNNRIYLLRKDSFEVYSTKASLLFSETITNARKLRRINEKVLILGTDTISEFDGQSVTESFSKADAKIVDKNSAGFLALIKDKLYLYRQNK